MIRSLAYGFAILLLFTITSCRQDRKVNVSFYFWKTVYQNNPTENEYMQRLHSKKMYVRIMDVDLADNGAVPVSPITFRNHIPDTVELIPVVFIVNDVLREKSETQLDDLAKKIVNYVQGKVHQSGKTTFMELQIDCDWTKSTRDNYFYLLRSIRNRKDLKGKSLSSTLRLHQLKNQRSSGVPPVDRVMLMCYNMGNLRLYGNQNSILEQQELEKYAGSNLSAYPMAVDIGLPLFSWAVVFREKQYAGISRRMTLNMLSDTRLCDKIDKSRYLLKNDLPALGLKRQDEIRWESVSGTELNQEATYLRKFISGDSINIIYFHLDEKTLKPYTHESLAQTADLFR